MKKKMFTKGSGSIIPVAEILHRYKFEDDVTDSVGTEDGTATDITYTTYGVGKSGIFNGSTSKVNLPSPLVEGLTEMSFSCLVYLSNVSGRKDIYMGQTNLYSMIIRVENNKFWFGLWTEDDGIVIDATSSTTLSAITLYHLTMTYDGANIRGYIDGVNTGSNLAATGRIGPVASPRGDDMLGMYLGTANKFNGRLDEVIIWNKALTQEEITALADDQLAGIEI